MTVLVEHDNGVMGQYGISEDNITTLEELPSLIQKYIQAGSCIYKLTILKSQEGELDLNQL